MQWGLLVGGIAVLALTAFLVARMRDHRTVLLLAHNAPWGISLIVAGSGLIYYDTINASSLALIFTGIAAFNLGLLMSSRIRRHSGSTTSASRHSVITMRIYVGLLIAFAIGFATLLWTIQRLFGLTVLFTNPQAIRAYSDIQYLVEFPLWGKVLFYLGPLIVALTVNPTMVDGLEKLKWPLRGGIVFAVLLAEAASLQRTNIFVSIVLALAVFAYRSSLTRARVTRILIGGAVASLVCLIAFFGIAMGIGKTTSANPDTMQYYAPMIRAGELSQALYYGSSGIIAFDHLTQSNNDAWPPVGARGAATLGDYNPQTWGAATFSAVLKAIPIARPWLGVEPFTEVPMLTNAYTWLSPWYRDFRLPGVIAFPLLAALAGGVSVLRVGRSGAWVLLAGLVTSCAVWAPFTNRFLSTMTIELFAISVLLLYLERRGATAAEPRTVLGSANSRG